MTHEQVVAGIAAALRAGALTSDAVALEARRAAETRPPAGHHDLPSADEGRHSPVISLTHRRLAALPADNRPLPSMAAYDQLLRHLRPPAEGSAT